MCNASLLLILILTSKSLQAPTIQSLPTSSDMFTTDHLVQQPVAPTPHHIVPDFVQLAYQILSTTMATSTFPSPPSATSQQPTLHSRPLLQAKFPDSITAGRNQDLAILRFTFSSPLHHIMGAHLILTRKTDPILDHPVHISVQSQLRPGTQILASTSPGKKIHNFLCLNVTEFFLPGDSNAPDSSSQAYSNRSVILRLSILSERKLLVQEPPNPQNFSFNTYFHMLTQNKPFLAIRYQSTTFPDLCSHPPRFQLHQLPPSPYTQISQSRVKRSKENHSHQESFLPHHAINNEINSNSPKTLTSTNPPSRTYSPHSSLSLKNNQSPTTSPTEAPSTNTHQSTTLVSPCCKRREFIVSPQDIGLHNAFQPLKLDLGYCTGRCPYPLLSDRYNYTAHAFFLDQARLFMPPLDLPRDFQTSACVPIEYTPMTIMTSSSTGQEIQIRLFDSISAVNCGCR